DLDMARLLDVLLDEDALVAEARARFALSRAEAFLELAVVVCNAHAFAAAACRGLDHHGVSHLVGNLAGGLSIGNDAQVARHRGDAGFARELLRLDLVAHSRDRLGRRSDEDDAGAL